MMLRASARMTVKALDAIDWVQERVRDLAEWDSERGDIVSTIVMVGVFVVLAAVVGIILFNVTKAKASTVANCVNSATSCAGATP